jgi:integrase/recombinase XerD
MNVFEKLKFDMNLCGMSEVTQKNYTYHVVKFAEFINKPVEDAELDDVRNYLYYLKNEKKLGIGTVNYYHTCIKYLFQITLEKEWNDKKVPRLRGYKTLPVVLSKKEVKKILESTDNLKYKAILSTIYSSGLRISELLRLKVKDIDSGNMQIFIRKSKGNKDRYTTLSKTNLQLLRTYWQRCGKPNDYLFPGQRENTPLTPSSIRQNLKQSILKTGISKKITVHTFRHAFATHLLEAGVNIFAIKVLLGHSSISSTCRYLHLVRMDAFEIKNPLDVLEDANND